jgi:hypothetical protein
MIHRNAKTFTFFFVILVQNVISSIAFVPTQKSNLSNLSSPTRSSEAKSLPRSTPLSERRWNFNEGRGPWGFKKNAEIWNGRAAQMGFTILLLQELITGKGVIAALNDGDMLSYVLLGVGGVTVLGLTAFLAAKGKDNSISY